MVQMLCRRVECSRTLELAESRRAAHSVRTTATSCNEKSNVVFTQVLRGRPGGLMHVSYGDPQRWRRLQYE